jgi:hypothetical protein
MRIRPTTFRVACAFVDARHRHHKKPQGHKFSICLIDDEDGGRIVGVAIVGRPVERKHPEFTAQVTRLCTDGTPNACSMLYAACRRICQAMGYDICNTFTGPGESGTSLVAAGWVEVETHSSRSWNVPSRARTDKTEIGPRRKWETALNN